MRGTNSGVRRNFGYIVAGCALSACGTCAVRRDGGLCRRQEARRQNDGRGRNFLRGQNPPVAERKLLLPVTADKQQQRGGLRLDSREAMLKGGKNGAAIVVGKPELSPLISAVHYEGSLRMPPSGKLKPDEIAALDHVGQNGCALDCRQSCNFCQKRDGCYAGKSQFLVVSSHREIQAAAGQKLRMGSVSD